MEVEDDMIVLVVVNDNEKAKSSKKKLPTTKNSITCIDVDNLMETVQKHGEFIKIGPEPSKTSVEVDNIIETVQKHGEFIKIEPKDNEYQFNYVIDGIKCEPESNHQQNIEEDEQEGETETDNSDEEISPEDEYSLPQQKNKRRFTFLKPWQRRSFVAELRKQNKELRKDEELLINTLGGIMRTVKPPPPPKDFYIVNGTKFECVYCGQLTDTLPAATRHFQKKHGKRYLVCYACGVDFTWPGNLYKHEKRCIAPDAEIVLRARGVFLGRKGRSRPFLTPNKFTIKQNESTKFPCSMCSAVLVCKSTLESHENLHRGKRPFRCYACPAAYTSSSALSRHTKIHKGVQFLCDHCGRSFKVKGELISHMGTHNPIRKYGCEECSRRFAQKAALILHVNRVHRNLPPPCACQICPKRYPRMYLLKAHMKREHGMSIITRKMFFKTLPTMTEEEIEQSNRIMINTKG